MLKNASNQAENLVNFSVMPLTENQIFSSSAGSDLQAIRHGPLNIVFGIVSIDLTYIPEIDK